MPNCFQIFCIFHYVPLIPNEQMEEEKEGEEKGEEEEEEEKEEEEEEEMAYSQLRQRYQ